MNGTDVADKIVVVTGGARGLGRAMVDGLLGAGARVAALDRSWEGVALRGGPDALPLNADVTDEAGLARAFQATVDAFGRVDVLINNASYRQRDIEPSTLTRILDVPSADWRRMFDITTLGPLLVTRAFIRPMLAQRSGSIINISSHAGIQGRKGNQPYAAAKAALTNLSQTLAAEMQEHGIAVNIVYPAGARTTGFDEQVRARELATGVKFNVVPWRPEGIVPLILFLAGCDAKITGRIFDQEQWNIEHGLGGVERWGAP
jgi:NAD(P)-dependent dehydrogenase (short-subunit alcohol dehydrogenase family)